MNSSLSNNGGFPPLILKNVKKSTNNKERFMVSNINKNINIHQILKTIKPINILDNIKKTKDDLDIITSL